MQNWGPEIDQHRFIFKNMSKNYALQASEGAPRARVMLVTDNII